MTLIATALAGLPGSRDLARAQEGATASVRLADGFDFPVGKPDAQGYYKSRGFRANGHLGDDWNGGPGDSDLGSPIYNIGNGIVVVARDIRLGWGNTVVVRHAYMENGSVAYIDSLYAHLDRILVREGQRVSRGEQIATMGNGRGMYDAHLHFEIRKDIRVGIYTSQFPRDQRTYWDPSSFIAARRTRSALVGTAQVPMNTFGPPGQSAQPGSGRALRLPGAYTSPTPALRRGSYKVNRFEGINF